MYDLTGLREEFPVLPEVIYLDNAATTQTPIRSVEAICDFFYEYAGNYGGAPTGLPGRRPGSAKRAGRNSPHSWEHILNRSSGPGTQQGQ